MGNNKDDYQIKKYNKHYCEDCHYSVDCRDAPKQGKCDKFVFGITSELISHVGDQRWDGNGKNGYKNKPSKRKIPGRMGTYVSGYKHRPRTHKKIKLFCVGVQTDDNGNAIGRINQETMEA